MIEIKDIQGSVIYSTGINKGAKRKFQLMKEDYITLPFSLEAPLNFGLGSYVEIDGIRYEITTRQNPTYNKTTGGYDYNLRFDAYYWKWKNKIFKFTPEVGGQEASWSLTASLDVHLGVFLKNLEALGYTYRGIGFKFSIDATVENKAMPLTYNNTNMIDALSAMAEAWQCEWWVEEEFICFGRCEQGEAVDFEIGSNVAEMTSSASQSTYATRLYAFGSTRNIPANYRPTENGAIVGGVVQKRLMLPKGTPYVDAYKGMKEEEAIEEVVIFEDIYPKMNSSIDSVSTYESTTENEDGTTTTETFYRFTDSGITFSKDYILEGEELKVQFTGGSLNGMEFGLVFNPEGKPEKSEDGSWNPEAQLFEVVANEDYGRKLPDSTLKPKVGDTFILIGWDSTKIEELGIVADAEEELLKETLKLSAKRKIDPSTYNCKMYSNYMYALPMFQAGDRVNLINSAFFKESRQSRIVGYEYCLDLPFDNPVFIVGETLAYSRIGALENKLDSIIVNGIKYEGNGVNLNRYLRKDRDDRSRGVIASDKGFEAGGFVSGATGAAVYKDKQGAWHIETDNLHVRRKFSANEVDIQTTNYIGGQTMLSAASMRIDSVEELADRYRCLFRKKNGEGDVVKQEWKVGDCAYCNTFNLELQADGTMGNHFFWREVIGVSKNDWNDEFHYVELSKSICAGGSSAPKSGDKVVHLGYNKTDDVDRQNAIVIAGAGTGSPYIHLFVGIKNFILPEPEQLKPGDNRLSGVLSIKSGSTGWQNLSGLPDSIQNAVDLANKAQETIDGTAIGAVNLLQNSGFTGSYQSEDMVASDLLSDSTELFSRKTDKWEGNIMVYADSNAVSGYSAQLGNITQQVKELIAGEKYVVSFKARGSAVNLSCGNFKVEQKLTSAFTKYSFKFEFGGSRTFFMDGNARICDLQLERGTISTDWNPSPYDNDKSFAEFQSLKYLQDAIVNGNTSVLGGLILASMLKLGNYKDGKMQKVNAGVSGICNDENDVAFWAGGSFENAIKTIMKFKENPQYKPTESEWASLAKFAVSHGGDAVFRGTIFAENGIFRGRLEAEEGFLHGKFETSIEGNRIVIDPEDKSLKMYNGAGLEILTMTFVDGGENWTWGEVNLKRYNYDSETEQGVLAFESRMTASDVDLYNRIDNTWTRMTTQGYQVTASANERHYNIITSLDKRYLDNTNFVYVSRIQSDCWAVDAANVGIGEVYAEPEYDDEGTLLSRVLKVKV